MGRRRTANGGVSFFAFQDIITSVVGIFVLITLIMVLELAQTVAEAKGASGQSVSQQVLDNLAALEAEVQAAQAEFDQLSAAGAKGAGTNRFNRDQQLATAREEVEELNRRIQQTLELTKETEQSLVEAEQIEKELLAQSRAMEADRTLVDAMLAKRAELEKFAAVLEIEKPIVFRDQTDKSRFVVLVRVEGSKIIVSDALSKSEVEFSGSTRLSQFERWLASCQLSKRQLLVIVKPAGVDDFREVQRCLDDANAVWGFDVAASEQNFRIRFELDLP